MPIYKRCSRCGKRIEAGTTCPCVKARHKEYDRYSRDSRSKQYYHSKEWDRVRRRCVDVRWRNRCISIHDTRHGCESRYGSSYCSTQGRLEQKE